MRLHLIDNLGIKNRDTADWMLQYKQGYFVDWRICDRLKKTLFDRWDFLLDINKPDQPKLVEGKAILEGLKIAAGRPFSVVPFFDPGLWGGQWMKGVCNLDPSAPNYAWCFNCVPEENSLLLKFGNDVIEIPSINLVFRHPRELLGDAVHERFGDEFLDVVRGYKDKDFPLDFLVLDMGWHTRDDAVSGMGIINRLYWTGYSWNKKLIPDPAYLIKKLHDDGLAVTLNDHPHDGIRRHETAYPDFMRAMGEDPATGKDIVFNAGSKKYMDNFFKYAHGPHDSIGVDFWWLDWQQDYLIPSVEGFPGVKHLQWLNELYYQNSCRNGKRGLILSRYSGWGGHRYPIYFSGDATGNWDVLKFEIDFTTSSSNQGCFYWSHEIGGFYSNRNNELYVCWSQFALTTSTMRVHSSKDPNTDKRPWLWGEQAEKALRKVYHLRSQLMPYTYTSAWQLYDKTLPLNRGMYLEYPEVEEAFHQPQQYMFGDLLLAAPISSPGKGENLIASQKVWFPAGEKWYDLFNHKAYPGGGVIETEADIYNTPLFVKGGAPLPLQPYSQRPATEVLDTLIVRCYPGIPGETRSYSLYEDDGISPDFEKGYSAIAPMSYTELENGGKLIIAPFQGQGFPSQVMNRCYRIELPVAQLKSVTINGKKVRILYDDEVKLSYVLTTLLPVTREILVQTTNNK